MNVLHVISGLDPENGGPTFALLGLARAQVRAGLHVTVIATWQNASGLPVVEQLRHAGAKVHYIGKARGKLSRHPQLRSAVDEAVSQAGVVHIHALWEEIQHQAARVCQRRKVPYVLTPHGMLSPWAMGSGSLVNRWGKRLYTWWRLRRNLMRASAINFTTTTECVLARTAQAVPALGPPDPGRPDIIEPVGLDWSEFEQLPAPGAFRARHLQLAGRPIVLFLSRLSPQKGLDVLIPAFAEFARTDQAGAMLVLAGPDYDGYSAVVSRLIHEHRLEDRTLLVGMLRGRDRLEAMVDGDLFVLPSHHENFGIVVAEAMACGRPVLISKCVNLAHEVELAGAGRAVEGVSRLAWQLSDLMASEPQRRRYGQAGRQYAREHFDWSQIAHRWAHHYAALVPPKP